MGRSIPITEDMLKILRAENDMVPKMPKMPNPPPKLKCSYCGKEICKCGACDYK